MSEKKKPDLKTWWWYNWLYVLLGVAALAVALYSFLPNLLAPKPDFSLAVVSVDYVSDECLETVRTRLSSLLPDANGDGQVLITVWYCGADLSGQTEGSVNYAEASKLDADLIGKQSALFLTDEPDAFLTNVAVAIRDPVPCEDLAAFRDLGLPAGWFFTVRTDMDTDAVWQILCP